MLKSRFKNLRYLASALLALLTMAALPRASAFTIYGPFESWQTSTLDYGTRYYYGNDIELGAPKNYGEGSRLNIPVLTYAYDYTFLSYFGAKGVAAVDAAMNEFNKLPSAGGINLSKYLTQDNQAINYTAQAMALTDIKSTVMSLMLEHMGLEGESHVWDLRLRNPTPVTCVWGYDVINRNYDPVSYLPTNYVNGVQIGYQIWDGCNAGVEVGDAIEYAVQGDQQSQFVYTAVATRYAQQIGGYYLGLTRDDVGGLAYLYNRYNLAYETVDSNSVVQGFGDSTWTPVSTNNVTTASNGFAGIMGGIGKVSYVKVAYDSLIGSAFSPHSYSFSIPVVTNGGFRMLQVTRTVTQPDIIFAAGDLTVVPNAATPDNYPNPYERSFGFIASTLAGQSNAPVLNAVISPQEVITFNNVTGVYFNESTSFLSSDQYLLYPTLLWGYFDGTTNAPIVFPDSASSTQLIKQILSGGSNASLGTYNPVSLLSTNTNSSTSALNP
jgi:hypothetical protein